MHNRSILYNQGMLEDILTGLGILAAIAAALKWFWNCAQSHRDKAHNDIESIQALTSRLEEVEAKVEDLERSKAQESTKRIEKGEDIGKLIKDLTKTLKGLE